MKQVGCSNIFILDEKITDMVEKKSEKDTMNAKIIENEKSTHLKTINGDCIKKNI